MLHDPAARKLDAALICSALATATAALLILAHLFDARPLLSGRGPGANPLSLVATLLFATLATAQLGIHPASPIASLRGDGAGAHSRRQLLPAALLVPVLVGLLLLLALQGTGLDRATAVTLSVMANLLIMLVVVGITGRQLDRMDRRKREKQAAREKRVRRQGQRDGVTRLLNRLGWEDDLKEAERRCRKQRLPATVVIIDLDGLKRINDTQGHDAGDDFIRRAAKALKGAARRKDTLARLGGDEFAYLAVGCDEASAPALAERLRKALDAAEVPASLGYALRGKGGLKTAVGAADEAMYENKRARGGGRMA